MSTGSPPKDDEAKFNETLKRMLKSPPKPHKPAVQPKDKEESKPKE